MRVDLRELLTLSMIPGIGATRLINLVSHFKDTRLAITASPKELVQVEGIEKKTALNVVNFFRDSGAARVEPSVNEQLSRLNKADARIVTYWDKDFPANLKNIFDIPAYLFVRGDLTSEDKYAIALVGTRTASAYGIQLAEKFSKGFAELGITTISGLARGVDTIVHSATLKAGGRTLAIVGSGIDVMYPPENRELAERIIGHGAVVSEFPMGAKPDAANFPRRNRIISGLALGTVVVETSVEGGAMITASIAFDQNREVFAIPSAVNEKKSSGTNLLIKQDKATLVESPHDVVEVLAPRLKSILKSAEVKAKTPPPQLSLFEQKLCDALGDNPVHIDALAMKLQCSTADALVHLLSLEFKGIVRQHPGKMFTRLF